MSLNAESATAPTDRVCGWWKSFLSVVGEESGTGQVQVDRELMTTNVLTHIHVHVTHCACTCICTKYMYRL